jgi:hypothetical protein
LVVLPSRYLAQSWLLIIVTFASATSPLNPEEFLEMAIIQLVPLMILIIVYHMPKMLCYILNLVRCTHSLVWFLFFLQRNFSNFLSKMESHHKYRSHRQSFDLKFNTVVIVRHSVAHIR